MIGRLVTATALVVAVLALGNRLQRAPEADPLPAVPAPGVVIAVAEPGDAPLAERILDARVDRLPALYVAAGEAITPFVPITRRDLEIHLISQLEVDLSDRYIFHAYGSGTLELQVDEDEPIELDPTAEGTASDRVKLKKGPHRLHLVYRPPAEGDAVLRLWWSGRRFSAQPIAAERLSHDSNAATVLSGSRLRHGRELLARHDCAACHQDLQPADGAGMRGLHDGGPSLQDLGARLRPDWIAAWLQDPQTLRPDATMPRLLHLAGADASTAARDITAALVADASPAAAPAGDVARGKTLFGSRNCFACHDTGPTDAAADGFGGRVSLQFVAAKWQPAALVAFLRQPNAHYAAVRMPEVHLEVEEAADLAAWLLATGTGTLPAVELADADAARGTELLSALHCTSCHDASAADAPAIPLEDPAAGCLSAEPIAAPRHALDAADRAAITAVLDGHRESLGRHVPAEYAARTWRDLRCDACHQRDGQASGMQAAGELAKALGVAIHDPHRRIPELSQLGAKFDPDWVEALLAGELEHRTRPYLEVHMPAFPAYAEDLAEGLARQEGFGPEPEAAVAPAPDQVALGRQLSGAGGYQCQVCHAYAGKDALAAFEAPAPNLALANDRLRHDFFHRWMRDPLAIDPHSRMPRFTLPDDPERALRADIAEGSAQTQFEAIWAYLRAGWQLQPPE